MLLCEVIKYAEFKMPFFFWGGGGVKSEKVGGETVVTNMQEC